MRSYKLTLILCGLMLLITPAKAHAWWELLDYLSGPGPFVGPRVDVRWCPPRWEKDLGASVRSLDTSLRLAAESLTTADKKEGASELHSALSIVRTNLNDISTVLRTIRSNFPIVTDGQIAAVTMPVAVVEGLLEPVLTPRDFTIERLRGARTAISLPAVQAIAAADVALDVIKNGLISVGATGILVSLCNPDKVRTIAFEGGFSVMHSFSADSWANSHTIWLYELSGGISVRPYSTKNVDHDYFDFGIMTGAYFFSSPGMEKTVTTWVVQPFVDVHAPTTLVNATGAKYWFSQFTLRVGFPIFGSAIPASDFNGVDQKDIEKVEAKRLTFTVYYNVWPKLRKRTHAL
jgi:hypothetical protein